MPPFSSPRHTIPGTEAGADLSSSQYLFGIINSSGVVVVNTSAGGVVDGVIQDDPDTAGFAVTLECLGVTRCVAGGTVTQGDLIMSDAAGKGVTATTTNYFRGRALTAAASGEIFALQLSPMGYVP
jgi:hypothetical protein